MTPRGPFRPKTFYDSMTDSSSPLAPAGLLKPRKSGSAALSGVGAGAVALNSSRSGCTRRVGKVSSAPSEVPQAGRPCGCL